MVEKIREEGEKWVIKQGEGIFIYLFLSPLPRLGIFSVLFLVVHS